MRIFKWPSVFLLVILCFGCSMQRRVNLTIESEPPNVQIYEEGKLIGNTPLNLSYTYEVMPLGIIYGKDKYTDANKASFKEGDVSIQDLLRPRTFRALKDGFKPQIKSFRFSSPHENEAGVNTWKWSGKDFFVPPYFSLLFTLDPLEDKPTQQPQQQQQSQQQQAVVVVPGAGGGAAKTYGALTIMTSPAQAEIYIDGTFVATTPASSLQLEVGPHKIEIQKSGFKTWTRIMQVLPNSPVRIEVELEKI